MNRHNILVESPNDVRPLALGEDSTACPQGGSPAGTDLDGEVRPCAVGGVDTGAAPSRSSGSIPFVTIEPQNVERGDRLAGVAGLPVVDRIVLSRRGWMFGDVDDVVVAVVAIGRRVQVCVGDDERDVLGDSVIGNDRTKAPATFSGASSGRSPGTIRSPQAPPPLAVNAGEVELSGPPFPALTPMAASGEVGRRSVSRAAVDPCEGLGSVVAQDGDSSACRPNTRPRARLIATEGL